MELSVFSSLSRLFQSHSGVCVCVVPEEAKRDCQIPCSWSYKQLGTTLYGCWELNSV